MSELDWMDDAVCRGKPSRWFFPGRNHPTATAANIAAAKNCCNRCPVTDQCLTYAIGNDIEHGIWGGLEPAERQRAARQPRKPPAKQLTDAELQFVVRSSESNRRLAAKLDVSPATISRARRNTQPSDPDQG